MDFIETRGNDKKRKIKSSFTQAILNPSASFGGLYVPSSLPMLGDDFIKKHLNSSYKELAFDILEKFDLDLSKEDILSALDAYNAFDDKKNPAPIVKIKNDLFVQEQYHGPTKAFKDMALAPFGVILSQLAKTKKQKYLILTATSGDTGPAALHAFANQENIQIVCMYPKGGTSDVQRLQMCTQDAKNVKVLGINGNFDDTQKALKSLLNSDTFKEELKKQNIKLTAANSVNFARILFQIVYHFHSYISLLKNKEISSSENIYLAVPSGNFGNILGAYYAKKMGLRVEKLLVCSNENNILTTWIKTGVYDIRGKALKLSKSPAMDILRSSNIERVIFDLFGANRTKELMQGLEVKEYFKLNDKELVLLQEYFGAIYSDDAYGLKTIKKYLEDENYLMDTHSATCIKAYENLKTKPLKMLMYSTAHWSKFSPAVLNALKEDNAKYNDKEALEYISKNYSKKIPKSISDLFEKEIIHKDIINKEDIEEQILKFISK